MMRDHDINIIIIIIITIIIVITTLMAISTIIFIIIIIIIITVNTITIITIITTITIIIIIKERGEQAKAHMLRLFPSLYKRVLQQREKRRREIAGARAPPAKRAKTV
jgi:hypothetical protein